MLPVVHPGWHPHGLLQVVGGLVIDSGEQSRGRSCIGGRPCGMLLGRQVVDYGAALRWRRSGPGMQLAFADAQGFVVCDSTLGVVGMPGVVVGQVVGCARWVGEVGLVCR